MGLLTEHLISAIVFSPFLLGILLLFIKKEEIAKIYGLIVSLLTFILSCFLYLRFDASNAGFQLVEKNQWIQSYGIQYLVGVDGISLMLIMLTTLLMPIIFLSSWHSIEQKVRSYLFFMLMLESGILGAFVSLDIFLFYLFWESMLIPMFFIIGVWGGKERIYAASKFFLYTVFGSIPMLVAIIYLLFQSKVQFGNYSAAVTDLYRLNLPTGSYFSTQGLIFLAFSLAFAVKVPMFPLHTWLPDAHVQAPTGGSVILAGVLLKLGIYGFMRFAMPLSAGVLNQYAPIFMAIAAVAIIYGAFVAMAQSDIKKLVAYSSVSHMGYVVLGLFAFNQIGVSGSVYQMLNHGVSTGALFLLVGILYERYHTRDIEFYNGLAKVAPLFAIIMLIVTFSSIALPGTNGFIGEFLILQGAFLSSPLFAFLAGFGVIFGAVYMLWLCQRILFGKVKNNKLNEIRDVNLREFIYLAPILILIFVMGIYPKVFMDKMDASIKYFSDNLLVGYKPTITYSVPEKLETIVVSKETVF